MEGKGKAAGIALRESVETALLKFGILVEGTAVLLAPYDKGRLRASITFATRAIPAKPGAAADQGDGVSQPSEALVLHVGTALEYAMYQELGTKFMDAQPFLGPALKMRAPLFSKILKDEFAKAIRKVQK
jgi:HK97 gp10 family phage protein